MSRNRHIAKKSTLPPVPARDGEIRSTVVAYRLLQIGDIHFPDWSKIGKDIDQKDMGLSKPFARVLARDPIQTVLRDITLRVHGDRYDAITLMGDLTSWGDLTGYETILSRLSGLLDITHQRKLRRPVVLVPGNHDVSRPLALSAPLEGKFVPLREMLEKYDWPLFPTHHVEKLELPPEAPSAVLLPINTCLGCGEKRHFPDSLQKEFEKLIQKINSGPTEIADLEQVYEKLDTPAVDERVIETLCHDITELRKGVLPIIIAHHNLLPQSIPRIAPYTELINGGQLRKQLLRTGRQVLFLHGHVHDDPIEIIHDARLPEARIVCIAAPAIQHGYNEIELYVSKSKGVLGCRITPMRFKAGQGLNREPSIDIGLCTMKQIGSQIAYRAMQVISDVRSAYFDQFYDDVTREPEFAYISKPSLVTATQELYFSNMMIIENPTEDPLTWRVRM